MDRGLRLFCGFKRIPAAQAAPQQSQKGRSYAGKQRHANWRRASEETFQRFNDAKSAVNKRTTERTSDLQSKPSQRCSTFSRHCSRNFPTLKKNELQRRKPWRPFTCGLALPNSHPRRRHADHRECGYAARRHMNPKNGKRQRASKQA